jgi:hypothetical protein
MCHSTPIFDCFLPLEKNPAPVQPQPPPTVFGTPLEESLEVAQIANLPAIVFRCIQYLELKKADQEEGIYRLSGSSAVIKSLKDRFNTGPSVSSILVSELSAQTNLQRATSTCSHRMSIGTRMLLRGCSSHICVISPRVS